MQIGDDSVNFVRSIERIHRWKFMGVYVYVWHSYHHQRADIPNRPRLSRSLFSVYVCLFNELYMHLPTKNRNDCTANV